MKNGIIYVVRKYLKKTKYCHFLTRHFLLLLTQN
nr:MAG TPA: hypothetical protein [Bacteriophage sp.]DAZ04856.1 MAG TPA: hypothetical protein [Caudoviricetes sp.]